MTRVSSVASGAMRAAPRLAALAVILHVAAAAAAGGAAAATEADELLALAPAHGDDACAAGGGADCSLKLLQRRARQTDGSSLVPVPQAPARPKPSAEQRRAVMAGSSVYFVVLDRFARADGNNTPCNDEKHWCGGTIRGITKQLDYIAEMGFDTLWITPVVKQYEGETKDGTGFMGYWAKNHYEIDPHYGTPQDLKDLVGGLHDRNMSFMLDIVMNHVGPVHSARDVEDLYPFNKVEYFHTPGIGTKSFDEYAAPGGKRPANMPLQAMWSGGQCRAGESCNCFSCQPVTQADFVNLPPPSWDACPFGKMVWNASSPCPWDSLSAFCMPGDFQCKGYDERVTLEGWFYDLGDLNQSVPFVRKALLDWTRWMVETYDVDMLRLDTAGFVPFDFLSELQEAAGVPIIGEVTATNMSYHASIQSAGGRPGLDGVLNFPLYYAAQAGFCHTFFPRATGNLTFLASRMIEQAREGLYADLDNLGNFVDNHDVDRLFDICKGDVSRMVNAMTWVMLARGTPIIYYGTEEARVTEQRESMWNYNYTHGRGFHWFKYLNALRKEFGLQTASQYVRPFVDHSKLAFSRGDDQRVWVYLNNMESGDEVVRYCSNLPQAPEEGHAWTNYLTGQPAIYDADGCLRARNNIPLILIQRRAEDIVEHRVNPWDTNVSAPTWNPFKEEKVYKHSR
mmetsp:Transcript_15265/g.41675  ORF Transcript_15265/g.41675 Transcript_15265/m.41675 type:complete len:680 (-) Transcript_15265:625-2664(-)